MDSESDDRSGNQILNHDVKIPKKLNVKELLKQKATEEEKKRNERKIKEAKIETDPIPINSQTKIINDYDEEDFREVDSESDSEFDDRSNTPEIPFRQQPQINPETQVPEEKNKFPRRRIILFEIVTIIILVCIGVIIGIICAFRGKYRQQFF